MYIPFSSRLLLLVFLLMTGILTCQSNVLQYHLIRDNQDSIPESNCINPHGLTGKKLNEPFYVKVIDNKGRPVAGYPVSFIILSKPIASSGTFVEKGTVYTDAAGRAGTFLYLGNCAGLQKLKKGRLKLIFCAMKSMYT